MIKCSARKIVPNKSANDYDPQWNPPDIVFKIGAAAAPQPGR